MVETVAIMRSLHLLFAVIWGGGSLYHGLIAVKGFVWSRPDVRADWFRNSKYGPFLGISSLLTVVFGLVAYIMIGADSYGAAENAVLSIGMLAGTIGMLIGWAGHLPLMVKINKARDAGDDAAVAKFEHREHVLDNISFVVVLVAVVTMATFRLF